MASAVGMIGTGKYCDIDIMWNIFLDNNITFSDIVLPPKYILIDVKTLHFHFT